MPSSSRWTRSSCRFEMRSKERPDHSSRARGRSSAHPDRPRPSGGLRNAAVRIGAVQEPTRLWNRCQDSRLPITKSSPAIRAPICWRADGCEAKSTWRTGSQQPRRDTGKGRVVLIAFRPQFRAQPHETFKLVFNSIHSAGLIHKTVNVGRPDSGVDCPTARRANGRAVQKPLSQASNSTSVTTAVVDLAWQEERVRVGGSQARITRGGGHDSLGLQPRQEGPAGRPRWG